MMHDLFNSRRIDEIEQHCAPGYMYEDLPRALTIKSTGEFADWLKSWVASFSDGSISSAQYVEGIDHSVAMYHGRGTNDGALGPFPATGRTVDVPFCEVLHYASDGKVLSGEVYYDQLTMLAQLGHVSPPSAAADSLEPMVQRLFAAFDALDLDALTELTLDDAQGIDEIARTWLRGRDAMNAYLGQLKSMISDVRSTYRDFDERITGDTALVTCWLDQDYTLDGQRVHVSAPTTITFRRVGMDWKVALIHTIPLPED
ncbi:MAG TPA: nuclear transport factor 2 family protein [Nocardioidaceae bacterium]|nr:nuclear transport factor 2 family protein [Nocardioidaceae bacterium]